MKKICFLILCLLCVGMVQAQRKGEVKKGDKTVSPKSSSNSTTTTPNASSSNTTAASGTPKKKKKVKVKQSRLSRAYHNLTGHYNYYYNADYRFTQSKDNLEKGYQDNFNQILPLHKYSAVADASSESSNLDETIKKVSVNLNLHRRSKWADDSYLLMGKAQFLKKEWADAEKTFGYMVGEFDPEKVAADKAKRRGKKTSSTKKKVEPKKKTTPKKKANPKDKNVKTANTPTKEKPRRYFLKHRPVHDDAILWLARTYIEQKKFDEANSLITRLNNDKTLPKVIRRQLPVTTAHLQLAQENYTGAMTALEESIKKTKGKKRRARQTYILAQLQQKAQNYAAATELFKKVLKSHANYDMDFNSMLNIANNGWASGTTSTKDALAMLKKMLNDRKNEEFRDQIYFSMAKVSLKQNDNQTEAIEYLKNSLLANKANPAQKAEAYLMLADIYWTKDDFIHAKAYYDSTAQTLAKTDARYDIAAYRNENLTSIAQNLLVLGEQDSLLRVASMGDAERKKLAKTILKQRKAERRQKLIEEQVKGMNEQAESDAGAPPVATAPSGTGNWWAYNAELRKKGAKDFEKRWGKRKLQDDWRHNTREADAVTSTNAVANVEEEATDTDEIFKNLPTTPEQKAAANKLIEEALYSLGTDFRIKLNMPKKSIQSHEDLLKRKADTEHEKDVYYTLYLNHTDERNAPRADYYKNLLLTKFAGSNYAKIVSNPDFRAEQERQKMALDTYYNTAFGLYDNGKYEQAYKKAIVADSIFGSTNKLNAKFALLAALCSGSVNGKEAYITALKSVQTKFPNTPEQLKAGELLVLLSGEEKGNPNQIKLTNDATTGDFSTNLAMEHYVLILLKEKDLPMNSMKNNVSDFNTSFFGLKNLKVSTIALDAETQLIVVRRFEKMDDAANYLTVAKQKTEELLGDKYNHDIVSISKENYATLLQKRNFASYVEFFQKNYK